MLRCPHTVRFAFRLPPILLRAPIGLWPRAPRGVTVEVERNGAVEVACTNGSELHARSMVITAAASFLRTMDSNAPPTTIAASLTAPSCGDRKISYAITLGVRVSIARTGEAPAVFGNVGRRRVRCSGRRQNQKRRQRGFCIVGSLPLLKKSPGRAILGNGRIGDRGGK